MINYKKTANYIFIIIFILYIILYIINYKENTYLTYIKIYLEGAIVGALADWFAITSIFRRPLGFNLPHTNLVSKNKSNIANNIALFFEENFLENNIIGSKLMTINYYNIIKNNLDHKMINNILENIIIYSITKLKFKNNIGFIRIYINILKKIRLYFIDNENIIRLIDDSEYNYFIDFILVSFKEIVSNNSDLIKSIITNKYPIISTFIGDKLSYVINDIFSSIMDDILRSKDHKARIFIKNFMLNKLKEIDFNKIAYHVIIKKRNNNFRDLFLDIYNENITYIKSILTKYVIDYINNLDKEWVNNSIYNYIYSFIVKNKNNISNIIRDIILNWDDKYLSHKLENQVGKDLQFIRINGTILGGIISLLLYIIALKF